MESGVFSSYILKLKSYSLKHKAQDLPIQVLQKINLYDPQLIPLLLAVLGLEEVEFAGSRFHHFHYLSESISVCG